MSLFKIIRKTFFGSMIRGFVISYLIAMVIGAVF